MKIFKKVVMLVCLGLVLNNIFACNSKNMGKNDVSSDTVNEIANNEMKTKKVVSTIFPIYDIVRNIVPDDNYELTLLLDSGIDIHNFSPTANDIMKLAEADLFIYIGGESDEWVDKVVATAQNKNLKTLNLMNALEGLIKEEEVVEGMQHEHEEGEEHEHEHEEDHPMDEEHDEGEEHENDEHIWLSLKNAKEMTRVISEALIKNDSGNKDIINKKANEYKEKLNVLDKKYMEAAKTKKYDIVLFGDRFPFRYLVDDYGIKYYAAFSGCSAEAEASFETIAFLAKKLDELDLRHVCAITGKEPKIAETIIKASNDKNRDIVLFNSMEGITNVNDAENTNYLNIMEENLEALKKAIK